MELNSYLEELTVGLSEAWDLAKSNVKKAQRRQKKDYDKGVRDVSLHVGNRVFLFVPSAKQGKAHNLLVHCIA